MWGACEQIRADFSEVKRGPLNVQGQATAGVLLDSVLPSTEFQVVLGAKRIPEVSIKTGEQVYHQKLTLGLESMRAGFGNQKSAETTKKFYALNFEKYTGTNLDNAGESMRDGQALQVIFTNAGITGIVPEKIYLHLRNTSKVQIRTGVVRLVD